MRLLLECLLLTSPVMWAQLVSRHPVFEVATIKMTDAKGGAGHSHENDTPGLFRGSMTLKSYVMTAYNVKDFQVIGGPKWVDDTTYEIVAKLERTPDVTRDDTTSIRIDTKREEQLHVALQWLLADRFQLEFHHELKIMPSYVLTAVKGKFKLQPISESGQCGTSSNGDGRSYKLVANCIDMKRFASVLARRLRQPVFDVTGVKGLYNFVLQWSADDLVNRDGAPQLDSLFDALRDQLGLRIESKKAPTDMIVIDRAERPAEN
jgi:uncharacterized protein (TIGR03435 family)